MMSNGNSSTVIPETVESGSFVESNHFYPKALNALIDDQVSSFMKMNLTDMIKLYVESSVGPSEIPMDATFLEHILRHKPHYFSWSGSDLFHVSDSKTGVERMVLIETNSCPAGQKSMPQITPSPKPSTSTSFISDENDNYITSKRGYHTLIHNTFQPMLYEHEKQLSETDRIQNGVLAVIYDKNKMECSGYASAMADVFGEKVYLVEFTSGSAHPSVRFVENDQIMQIRDPSSKNGNWLNVRACFKYVTQCPWDRIPLCKTRTLILNPIVCCLAGGRNKQLAAAVFSKFNETDGLANGISLSFPHTIYHVERTAIREWVNYFGGRAVIKSPYSNAGQGVWCIYNESELNEFLQHSLSEIPYDKFIVQSMIGHSSWKDPVHKHKNPTVNHYRHVGTIPDDKGDVYVSDLRMMIHFDYLKGEFRPLALFARKAAKPLNSSLTAGCESWDMLGTNLSVKHLNGEWTSDQDRLLLCDNEDFAQLGLSLEDLVSAFIQSCIATISIDKLACFMYDKKGNFQHDVFDRLNQDHILSKEFM